MLYDMKCRFDKIFIKVPLPQAYQIPPLSNINTTKRNNELQDEKLTLT